MDHQLSQQLWSSPLEDLLHLSRQAQVIRQLRWCNGRCLACPIIAAGSSQRQTAMEHGNLLTVLRLCSCLVIRGSRQYGVGTLHSCMTEPYKAS